MKHANGFYETAAAPGEHLYINKSATNYCTPHFHDSVEIVFCYEDGFVLNINGEDHTLEHGDIAFINGMDVHRYVSQNKQTFVVVIGGNYSARFFRYSNGKTFPLILKHNPEAFKAITAVLDGFYARKTPANALIKYGFAYTLLGTLAEYYPLTDRKRRPDAHIVTELLSDIRENMTHSLSLEGYARKYGYSKTYLSSLFNAYTGLRFRDYLNRLRIERALQYMSDKHESGDTMLDIAMKCGFDSPNTFYRALKKFGSENPNF